MNIQSGDFVSYAGYDWPRQVHPIMRDLVLAKHWRFAPYNQAKLEHDPGEYMMRAAKALFTSQEFTISPYTEEHFHDWCTEDFIICWGHAASEKSNSAGLIAVLDWLTDPLETLTLVASTTLDMLQLRTFESVTRYYRLLRKNPKFLIPGKESKVRTAIIMDSDDTDATVSLKAGIKGVAVRAGTVEDAKASLQGAHTTFSRLILDELSAMRDAAMEARHNLSIGCKNFKLLGLCNPESFLDLACRHSVPIDGWASVNPEESHFWRTQWGIVRRHDGLKSPGLTEPEKYPYLLKQVEMDRIVAENHGNTDSPAFWTMVRAWPSPQGSEQTILSSRLIEQWDMKRQVIWGQSNASPILIAGLDPTFTSGGDNAVFQPAEVGIEAVTGKMVIAFHPEIVIPLLASKPRPIVYQVVDFVLDWADDHMFDLRYLGVDESGTQRLGDMIEVESIAHGGPSVQVCRVNYGAIASSFPVSARNKTEARKMYRNQVTELYYAVQEYGSFGQIRSLPDVAADQFCRRRVQPRTPKALEEKAKMKARIKRSPDQADALACCVAVAKWVLRLMPGATRLDPHGGDVARSPGAFSLKTLRMYDLDAEAVSYKNPAF